MRDKERKGREDKRRDRRNWSSTITLDTRSQGGQAPLQLVKSGKFDSWRLNALSSSSLSIYLSIHPSIHLLIHLSIYPFIFKYNAFSYWSTVVYNSVIFTSVQYSDSQWFTIFKGYSPFIVIINIGCIPSVVQYILAAYFVHSSLYLLILYHCFALLPFPLHTSNH